MSDVLQEWTGKVVYFDEETGYFEVQLTEVGVGEPATEYATFHVNIVQPESERVYVENGRTFTCRVTGTLESPQMQFTFPHDVMTSAEIAAASSRALEVFPTLKWVKPDCPNGLDATPNACSLNSCTYCRNL